MSKTTNLMFVLRAANIIENMDHTVDLLDSSHLLNELTYINDHHHALHIPLNIFLLHNKVN